MVEDKYRMPAFEQGDRVRVDIPDESDPDFDWHGEHGVVVAVIEDDADKLTGEDADSSLYRVKFEQENTQIDFRHRDLRPPFVE